MKKELSILRRDPQRGEEIAPANPEMFVKCLGLLINFNVVLINFNVVLIKNGITRIVNGLKE
jgi:hypothetical protein